MVLHPVRGKKQPNEGVFDENSNASLYFALSEIKSALNCVGLKTTSFLVVIDFDNSKDEKKLFPEKSTLFTTGCE